MLRRGTLRSSVTPSETPPFRSPSDLREESPEVVRVGGRVLAVGEDGCALGDAFGSVRVRLELDTPVAVGDFVEIEGIFDGKHLTRTRTLGRSPGMGLPTANGEQSRFLYGGVGAKLGFRARVLREVRRYFEEERFVEVDTPAFSECPGLDANVFSLGDANVEGHRLHLVTSPEFHMKRLLVGGLPRIYQIAHSHRSGESGPLHEPVFSILEWYRAFAGYESMLEDTEKLLRRAAEATLGSTELVVRSATAARVVSLAGPFERVSVREAFARFAGVPDPGALYRSSPTDYFQTLVDRVEPALAALPRPTFLVEFPIELAALARPSPSDASVAERFELYVGGVELSNGYGELTDGRVQRARFEAELEGRRERGEPTYPLDEAFLAALDEGMPPSSGNALGIDRLVAILAGESEIRRVVAFPESLRRERAQSY